MHVSGQYWLFVLLFQINIGALQVNEKKNNTLEQLYTSVHSIARLRL